MMVPFNLPTKIWTGKIRSMTPKIRIPGHPNLVIKITIIPARAKGVTKAAKNTDPFVSMVLKSLERRLIILPSYWLLAVYCDIFDSLV